MWDQILVLGDYGAGKTTTAIKMAYLFYRLGHPVFSNASCLFGWHLEREEMYTPTFPISTLQDVS